MATTVKDLERWVEAGLIDPKTAEAIEDYEGELAEGRTVGRGIEALAYLGSALILVAVGLLAVEFWSEIDPWGRLALTGGVTTVLLAVGFFLGRSEIAAVDRAQAFAWFLAALGVALTASVVAGDLAELDDQESFLVVSGVSFAAAIVLWRLRSSVLQMVAMGLAAYATAIAIVARFETAPDWAFGLSLAGVGALWLSLTWTGVLTPARTSYALAGVGLLLISFPQAMDMPWPLLGLMVGLALMGMSVALEENVLLGLGVLGLFVYIPMSIFELFGETMGVPFALLITGLVLLGVVLGTVRLRRGTGA